MAATATAASNAPSMTAPSPRSSPITTASRSTRPMTSSSSRTAPSGSPTPPTASNPITRATRRNRNRTAATSYRFDPASGALARVADDFVRPNGLAFSPDESLLYVSDSGLSHGPDKPHHIRRFRVGADNGLSGGEVFAEINPGIPTVSGSMSKAASGPRQPTASTSIRLRACCSARSGRRARSPISPSGAGNGTGCSLPPAMPCSCSTPRPTARRRSDTKRPTPPARGPTRTASWIFFSSAAPARFPNSA